MGIGEQFEFENTGKDNLEVDPSLAGLGEETERAPSYCQREREANAHKAKIRAVIQKHLEAMAEEFREFGQTTHGSVFRRQCDLGNVCKALEECGREPTEYTVSELCQRIRGFVEFINSEVNERGPV